MKRWSNRRLFLLSQIWKVLQEILKSPLPVWLTGRLSLAGNSPKFKRRFVDPMVRALSSARPALSCKQWFLISQFTSKHRPERSNLNSVDKNWFCGKPEIVKKATMNGCSVLHKIWFVGATFFFHIPMFTESSKYSPLFKSFSHKRSSCRAPSVSSHQLWPRVRKHFLCWFYGEDYANQILLWSWWNIDEYVDNIFY